VFEADLDGAPGLAVRGEVDLAVVATRSSVGAFVLDLCDVEFLDSTGLRVLLHARALLARDERALAVVCPPGNVRRLLEVVGVDDLFFLVDTREEVAAALVPAG
jgi:anti-sigma B factor antagonist